MDYLHYDFQAGPNDIIEVLLDKAANVLLLDQINYQAYRSGRNFHYFGGHATQSPVRLVPPHHGSWHVVIDFGGYAGTVRASARLIRG